MPVSIELHATDEYDPSIPSVHQLNKDARTLGR